MKGNLIMINKKIYSYKEVIELFDIQIKQNKNFEIDKELFELTYDLTIEDWKIIRTKEYWIKIDSLLNYSKKKMIIDYVKNYKKQTQSKKYERKPNI
jgi:hypothetical protein